MIVRTSADHLLLITQPDHAALAAAVMAAWARDPLPADRREQILLAVTEHDNGWQEEDASPLVDTASGHVLDFTTAPDAVRQRVWPRGAARLAASPYAAALVAQHAVSLHERHRSSPAWTAFFEQMEQVRDRALALTPVPLTTLQADYFFVRMGDLISLTFCNGWHEPQRLGDYELQLDGPRLTVRPDPFDRREILLSIPARQIPNQAYHSSAAAREKFDAAAPATVTGVVVGAP